MHVPPEISFPRKKDSVFLCTSVLLLPAPQSMINLGLFAISRRLHFSANIIHFQDSGRGK
jgi:hypothetical protein